MLARVASVVSFKRRAQRYKQERDYYFGRVGNALDLGNESSTSMSGNCIHRWSSRSSSKSWLGVALRLLLNVADEFCESFCPGQRDLPRRKRRRVLSCASGASSGVGPSPHLCAETSKLQRCLSQRQRRCGRRRSCQVCAPFLVVRLTVSRFVAIGPLLFGWPGVWIH